MSAPKHSAKLPPLDLSKWRKVPAMLMVVGGLIAVIGLGVSFGVKHDGGTQFAFSWLLAFMFCLSICLGALFLVLAHHLFDAGWSVPIRRFCEHIASLLFPWMFFLWIPVGLFRKHIYSWINHLKAPDEALHAKFPLFTDIGFWVISLSLFLVWWLLTNRLRHWSIKQDTTGGSLPTHKMRSYSYWGIFAFAITLTLACFMWMKALQYHWFSTMYGVYYFAGSVWMTLGLAYVITMILDRQTILTDVLHEHQYYFIGSLMFAFTVFYAYIHFAQYFIIWNGNLPETASYFARRGRLGWNAIGMSMILGVWLIPWMTLLSPRIKRYPHLLRGIAGWIFVTHVLDVYYTVVPALPSGGFEAGHGRNALSVNIAYDLVGLAAVGGIWFYLFATGVKSTKNLLPTYDNRLQEALQHAH